MSTQLGKIHYWYLGWLSNPDGTPNAMCQRIANSPVSILIAYTHGWNDDPARTGLCGSSVLYDANYAYAVLNLTPQVLALLHSKGIKVFGHKHGTDHGLEDYATCIQVVKRICETPGIDGYHDGEVNVLQSEYEDYAAAFTYFSNLYDLVKSYGKLVAYNTGAWMTGESIMHICDYVNFESNWWQGFTDLTPRYVQYMAWRTKYPAERFLGLTYTNDLTTAINDARTMWDTCHIGYPCSIPALEELTLPTWYDAYIATLNPIPPTLPASFPIWMIPVTILGLGVIYLATKKK